MASDMNNVFLIGRLTNDPELRHTSNGNQVASFSIANNYEYTSNGEKKSNPSFFNCVAWGKIGEIIAQYCKKGNRIAINGRLQQRTWEAQDGGKRSTVDIKVDNFQFLESKKSGIDSMGEVVTDSEDIPF